MSKTFVITISGSGRGAGKTLLAEILLPRLSNCAAIKVWSHGQEEFSALVEDNPGQSPGKDTARYLAAGARRAFLIRGAPGSARQAVDEIIENGEFDTVIVESNAVAREIESGLSLFVKGRGKPKREADICQKHADVTVYGVTQ